MGLLEGAGVVKPEEGAVGFRVISSKEQFKWAMGGGGLSIEDYRLLAQLPALYAYAFDSGQAQLAAELFVDTDDAFAMGVKGQAIAEGYNKRYSMIKVGKLKLRSRHVVSNLVVRADEKSEGVAHGSVCLSLYRNPLSSHPENDGPPDLLYGPANVGEYRFSARKCADGLWRFYHWTLQMHFARPTPIKSPKGRPLGASSSIQPKSSL